MTQPENPGQVLPFTARGKQLGALDLGSNSFHLLIAQESHGRIQVLDKHKEMVRLAEGLDDDNNLAEHVIERALACLERFAQRLRTLDPDNVRVVGTNTLRKAADSGDFINRAQKVLGHSIEIISGREEARLIYLGVCHDLGPEDMRRLVVDIGGGSTELILGRRTNAETLESLHMGCVSMSQRYFADGQITAKAMQRAVKAALVELEPIAQDYISQGWESTVGASGTINAINDVVVANDLGTAITAEALTEIQKRAISAGAIDDLQISGLAEERKAVFPGGLAILSAVFEALGIDSMQPAQSALREGLIYDLLGRQHEDDARDHTVKSLMQRYRIDDRHARQVRETAIALLSQVAMAWSLTDAHHKQILSWAADLHEIGMDISHSGYHKHGSYLLENMDMPGFSRSEQSQLATLVRAHRRKFTPEWLSSASTSLVRLSVLLRIATVLHRNRSHEPLPHIELKVTDENVSLSLSKSWLQEHPLTVEDLNLEEEYLAAVNLKLDVTKH